MDHRSVNLIVRTSPGPVGKRSWEPVLQYIVKLRARCVQPPAPPFTRRWVNIGPGYCYGPACGHIDLVHMVLDFVADDPDLARDTEQRQRSAHVTPKPPLMVEGTPQTRHAARQMVALTNENARRAEFRVVMLRKTADDGRRPKANGEIPASSYFRQEPTFFNIEFR